MPTRTAYRTCHLCEATCGIALTIFDGAVVRIEGDRDDPFSQGHICPKAHSLIDLDRDPDRLRRPVRRTPSGWVEIGWTEAWDLAAAGLARVRDAGGPDAVACYRGNPTIHDMQSLIYWNVVQQALPTKNRFSAGSTDTWPRYVQVGSMFGGMLHIPVPDLDRTRHLLIFGANPLVSNGSLMTAPGVKRRLRAIRARGGRIVTVDPRRTETAEIADEHVFVKPGTDAALLLAMVHTLFDEGLARIGRCGDFASGLADVEAAVQGFAPESVSSLCGVDPDTIRRLARELAAAESAACYGRMGTCVQPFGTLACWAIELLNILTGNLDRPGGVMFATPAASLDFAISPGDSGVRFGRHRSRVGGHDEIFGELPVAALAEEIETEGPGQVRALLTIAGNLVASAPNAARLERAFASLDFMVALDFYVNETTRFADVIIPPGGPLEQPGYDLALNHLAIRNVAKLSEPAVDPEPGTLPIWRTLLEISKRLMGLDALDVDALDAIVLRQLAERAIAASEHEGVIDPGDAIAALGDEPGPVRVLDLLLRAGAYGDAFGRRDEGLSVERLRAHPHGLDLGALEPVLPGRLRTASGKIELAPPRILADLPRLSALVETHTESDSEMLLIGRRDVRSMNSWLHNLPSLAKGRPRCTLQMSPKDADRLGLGEGDAAALETRVGRVVATVEVTDRMMPGVVSLPHGWGQDAPGVALRVASRRRGVNANLVTDDALLDVPSGASVLNGVPVRIARA